MAISPMVGFKLLRRNFQYQYETAWMVKMDFYLRRVASRRWLEKLLLDEKPLWRSLLYNCWCNTVVQRRLAQRRGLQPWPLANGRRTSGGVTSSELPPRVPPASTPVLSLLCFPSLRFPCGLPVLSLVVVVRTMALWAALAL